MFRALRKPVSPVVIVTLIASLLVGLSFATAPRASRALASAVQGTGGEFVPVQGRVLDTRSAPPAANAWTTVDTSGVAGVPASGVSAVQVTVTVATSAAGSLFVSPHASTPKSQFALAYGAASGPDSNTTIVQVGSDGNIEVKTTTSVGSVVDVQGYYTAGADTAAGGYVPVPTPTRIVDTRNGTGGLSAPLAKGSTTTVQVSGKAGVPTDASAVFATITAINGGGGGYFTPYAADATTRPGVAMYFPNNAPTALGTTVDLSAGGAFKLYLGTADQVDLTVDVIGYFEPGAAQGAFTPATVTVASNVAISSGATTTINVAGVGGVPLSGSGIAAAALSFKATNGGTNGGYFLAYASTDPIPGGTSTGSMVHAASTVSSFASIKLGTDGKIKVYNSGPDSITLTVGLQGWYTNTGYAISNGQSDTQQSVTLQADPNGGGSYVTYEYRTDLTAGFSNVPYANVKDDYGNTPTWPVAKSNGSFTPYAWNVRDTLAAIPANNHVAPDSLVQVIACYGASSSDTNPACGMPTNIDFSQADGSGSSADVGPGSVDELTGDFQLSVTDADAATALGSLSVGRTLTTLNPANASGAAGVFGPGWTADLSGPDAGVASLTPVDKYSAQGFILLTDTDGTETTYTQDPTNAQRFIGEGADADDTSVITRTSSTSITLTDADGTITTWTKTNGVWVTTSVKQPGSNSTSSYTYNGSGLVTRILAPVPSGVVDINNHAGCDLLPDSTPGCRSLKLVYGDGTTGPVGRLIEVDLSIPQTSSAANSIPVADYDFDSAGRLAHAWDPRISPALKTTYTYTSANRIASLSPPQVAVTPPATPALSAWSFFYDSTNRLSTVNRPDPSGSTATTTVIYGVSQATTGPNAGPVDLSAATTAHWGETTDLPVTGTAIFDPDHNPAGTTVGSVTTTDWPYASIDYLDVNGRTVNSAAYGAGAWQVDTTQYDPSTGNELWSLTAGNWAQARNPTADTDPYVASLSSGSTINSVDAAALLRSDTVYDPLTGNVTDTYGPTHPVRLANGSTIDARTHVATSYDEGAPTTTVDPTTGTPVNPASMQPYGLPTTVTTTAYDAQAKTDTAWPNIQVTHTGYDSVVSGDTSGWILGQASTSTVQMAASASSADLVTSTRFDANGAALRPDCRATQVAPPREPPSPPITPPPAAAPASAPPKWASSVPPAPAANRPPASRCRSRPTRTTRTATPRPRPKPTAPAAARSCEPAPPATTPHSARPPYRWRSPRPRPAAPPCPPSPTATTHPPDSRRRPRPAPAPRSSP